MTTAQPMTFSSIRNPLFRQTVGFDRFNDLFENLACEPHAKNSFPPYDIIKVSDNDYQISMAVAGFSESDIAITVENETLTVASVNKQEQADSEEGDNTELAQPAFEYLHQGIAKRHFTQKFRLADHMKVTAAEMKNGLLNIQLMREIPEEKKAQIIKINASN